MPSVSVRKVFRRNGKIYIRWSDKTEQEFDRIADLRQAVRDVLQDGGLREIMKTLLVAATIRQSNDGALLESLEGKTITIEMSPSLTLGVNDA